MDTTRALGTGRCTCGQVRYTVDRPPLIVHGCHCSWCQRETGAAFAVNALVETSAVHVTGDVERVATPSQSGHGQVIARCPNCRVALWSHYHQAGPGLSFIRVGTLDAPGDFPPDAHIYTSTRFPWVVLPAGAPAYAEFYDPRTVWSAQTLQRFVAARAQAGAPESRA